MPGGVVRRGDRGYIAASDLQELPIAAASSARALRCGPGCRGFESRRSPHLAQPVTCRFGRDSKFSLTMWLAFWLARLQDTGRDRRHGLLQASEREDRGALGCDPGSPRAHGQRAGHVQRAQLTAPSRSASTRGPNCAWLAGDAGLTRKPGAAPGYTAGSAHAVTDAGEIISGTGTGSGTLAEGHNGQTPAVFQALITGQSARGRTLTLISIQPRRVGDRHPGEGDASSR